jgi:hypothetical protein
MGWEGEIGLHQSGRDACSLEPFISLSSLIVVSPSLSLTALSLYLPISTNEHTNRHGYTSSHRTRCDPSRRGHAVTFPSPAALGARAESRCWNIRSTLWGHFFAGSLSLIPVPDAVTGSDLRSSRASRRCSKCVSISPFFLLLSLLCLFPPLGLFDI